METADPQGAIRVLLAEDIPDHQGIVAYILRGRGHTVDIAGDGQQAVCMARENRYDVILMDVRMPIMDGLEATKAIRAREDGQRRVPIVAVTANAMMGDRERCLEAGMDGYLSKPIDARQMIALVEGLAAGQTAPVGAGGAPLASSPTQAPATDANVFDQQDAMKCCFGRQEMFHTMVDSFFNDVENLLPQMRSALQCGDVAGVGELGHRLKGTVVYLGAKQATDAALRVERFARHGAQLSEAEEAVDELQRECKALKIALAKHQTNTGLAQDEVPGGDDQ